MGNSNGTPNDARLHRFVVSKSWGDAERFFERAGLEEGLSNLRYLHRRPTRCGGGVDYAPVFSLAVAGGAPIGLLREMILVGGRDVVTMTDSKGNTALHEACQFESPAPIIRLLIDVGGRDLATARSGRGHTALSLICNAGLGVRVMHGDRLLPMRKQSALDGRSIVEIVDRMIDLGGRDLVLNRDAQNQTALMYAAKAPSVPEEALIRIIRAGGRQLLTMTNNRGMTALHIALWKGEAGISVEEKKTFKTKAILEMIEAGGAELASMTGGLGLTPLHAACSFGAPPCVVQSLVDVGGTGLVMATTDEKGLSMTALRFAIRPCGVCPETVRILANAGGVELVSTVGGDGRTALDVLNSPGRGAKTLPNREEARRILEDVLRGSAKEGYNVRCNDGMVCATAVAIPVSAKDTSSADAVVKVTAVT